MVTKKAWNCQALTVTPLDLLGDASAGSSGGCHSPGLSLACPVQACDHGQITQSLDLVGTGSDHPNVTHCVNGFGHPLPQPREPPPTRSRAAPPTLSAKMASVLSRPVADLSLAALESRSA